MEQIFEGQWVFFSTTALLVFSSFMPVINPFGGAMFFLSMTNGIEHQQRARLARRVALYSFVILLVSLYAGNLILKFFGISIDVMRIAGGIVLFSTGWQVLNAPDPEESTLKEKPKSAATLSAMAFFPITLPLTTGPGSISVAVAFGATPARGFGDIAGGIVGIILNCLLIWVCYSNSDRVNRLLGYAGADAMTRIFSFILICIGVSVFWTGFSGLWATLPH